jgi:hypothetical protein
MADNTLTLVKLTATITSKNNNVPVLHADEDGFRVGADYETPFIAWADLDDFAELVRMAQELKARMAPHRGV